MMKQLPPCGGWGGAGSEQGQEVTRARGTQGCQLISKPQGRETKLREAMSGSPPEVFLGIGATVPWDGLHILPQFPMGLLWVLGSGLGSG